MDSCVQARLQRLSKLGIPADSPEVKTAAEHQQLLMAGHEQPNMHAIYQNHLENVKASTPTLQVKKTRGRSQIGHQNQQTQYEYSLDVVSYEGGDFDGSEDAGYADENYSEYGSVNSSGNKMDAGTVLRSRKSHTHELRTMTSTTQLSQELRDTLVEHHQNARGYSELDDQRFYPSSGKNLPRSPPRDEVIVPKKGPKGKHQRVRARAIDPTSAYAQEKSSSTQPPLPDFSAEPNQYTHLSTNRVTKPSSRRSTIISSALRPDSPAFSFAQPRPQPTPHQNSLLQLLTQSQSQSSQPPSTDAKSAAAYLNQVNRIAQGREGMLTPNTYSNSYSTPANFTTLSQNSDEFAFGSSGFPNTSSTGYFDSYAYQGAPAPRVSRMAQVPRYEGMGFGGSGSQAFEGVSGVGRTGVPYQILRGTTHYGTY
ncbi:hypothetical protein GLAREA_11514 [Glarea lozoyensis ATCC 20868]|uniref:Uncharacterized protein n=1 Tax=Glarea lozoyensis (strain ATCC 20868 / MF5171) TaxID=1116229 RepID=S3DE53_GLAL2|nr:uncharacterized protein GLAREA_11514 [Glarea lozoyensis ATCC 20868]EPE24933.1 hypothetical protein GLAREA_11514 [Glarea lozoyensis ATCC 20868]